MEIREIALLNNQGVDLLRRGNLKLAADTFRTALDLAFTRLTPYLTSAANTAEDEESIDQLAALQNAAAGHTFILQVGLPGTLPEGLENAFPSPSRNNFRDDGLYLQTQGFYLASELYQGTTEGNFIVEAIVNAFLLYNVGLVSQLHSIYGIGTSEAEDMAILCDSFKFRRRHATKSRSMYMRSRMILELAGVATQHATGIPSLDLLVMALYNNAAYGAFAEDDYDTCSSFFRELEMYKDSLQTMPSYSHWNDETVVILNRYISDFQLNALALRKPIVAPGA